MLWISTCLRRARWAALPALALATAACAQAPAGPVARPAPEPQTGQVVPATELPAWLQSRLAGKGDVPRPTSVWRQLVAGQTMYYLVLPCCDQFNELWDAQGHRVCAPDGGFTGRGDGRCTEAQRATDGRVQVWPASPAR